MTWDWNTETYPDGWYRVRVTASDSAANSPDRALSSSQNTTLFAIDNTRPGIDNLTVTYPKANDLRAAAAQVPAEKILAETDSPYLAPQSRRGRPNDPANVVLTVAELAKIRGEDADELGARIAVNATAAFSLP